MVTAIVTLQRFAQVSQCETLRDGWAMMTARQRAWTRKMVERKKTEPRSAAVFPPNQRCGLAHSYRGSVFRSREPGWQSMQYPVSLHCQVSRLPATLIRQDVSERLIPEVALPSSVPEFWNALVARQLPATQIRHQTKGTTSQPKTSPDKTWQRTFRASVTLSAWSMTTGKCGENRSLRTCSCPVSAQVINGFSETSRHTGPSSSTFQPQSCNQVAYDPSNF